MDSFNPFAANYEYTCSKEVKIPRILQIFDFRNFCKLFIALLKSMCNSASNGIQFEGIRSKT